MTDDDTNITLTATEWSVTVEETRNTGDYESITPRAHLKGEIPHRDELDEATRRCIKAKLLTLHKDLQEVVERAADNRVAVSDAEDWGVRNADE